MWPTIHRLSAIIALPSPRLRFLVIAVALDDGFLLSQHRVPRSWATFSLLLFHPCLFLLPRHLVDCHRGRASETGAWTDGPAHRCLQQVTAIPQRGRFSHISVIQREEKYSRPLRILFEVYLDGGRCETVYVDSSRTEPFT